MVVHITDLRTVQSYIERNPYIVSGVELGGYRSVLGVPILKQNGLIGVVNIYRQEVRPFTEATDIGRRARGHSAPESGGHFCFYIMACQHKGQLMLTFGSMIS